MRLKFLKHIYIYNIYINAVLEIHTVRNIYTFLILSKHIHSEHRHTFYIFWQSEIESNNEDETNQTRRMLWRVWIVVDPWFKGCGSEWPSDSSDNRFGSCFQVLEPFQIATSHNPQQILRIYTFDVLCCIVTCTCQNDRWYRFWIIFVLCWHLTSLTTYLYNLPIS